MTRRTKQISLLGFELPMKTRAVSGVVAWIAAVARLLFVTGARCRHSAHHHADAHASTDDGHRRRRLLVRRTRALDTQLVELRVRQLTPCTRLGPWLWATNIRRRPPHRAAVTRSTPGSPVHVPSRRSPCRDDECDPDERKRYARTEVRARRLAGEQIDAGECRQVDAYASTNATDYVEGDAPIRGAGGRTSCVLGRRSVPISQRGVGRRSLDVAGGGSSGSRRRSGEGTRIRRHPRRTCFRRARTLPEPCATFVTECLAVDILAATSAAVRHCPLPPAAANRTMEVGRPGCSSLRGEDYPDHRIESGAGRVERTSVAMSECIPSACPTGSLPSSVRRAVRG